MKHLIPSLLLIILTINIESQTAPDLPNAPVITGENGWVRKLVYSPKYFGPNAFPIAEGLPGMVDKESSFEVRGVKQYAPGDNTSGMYVRLNFVLLPNVVSVEFTNMVIDHYELTVNRREYLNAWTGTGKGTATGDIGIATIIQVIRNKTFPDMALRIYQRTVGGGKLEDARYCDAPSYFFDASFGKDIKINQPWLEKIRPFISGGFYCWQTNKYKHIQDDAPMANGGLNIYVNKFMLNTELAGYAGYENNGDKPILYRCNLNYNSNRLIFRLGYEKGLRDYDFTNFYISAAIKFDVAKYLGKLAKDENKE